MFERAILAIALSAAVAAAQGSSNVEAVRINAPYVTTPDDVVDAMLKLAGVGRGDTVYDLGCGDGRIVIAAARQYGAHGVGIDINPERIREANEGARNAGLEGLVKFAVNDLFDADIRGATVVTLYLLPDLNIRLRPKLQKELKAGTRVVSHEFRMGDWKPDREVNVRGSHLYLWTITR